MSSGRSASGARRRRPAPTRVIGVWRELPQERRLAALACLALFLTLFLPWYQETVFANGVTSLRSASSSLTGWGAFSFVEAAVLLVAAAVLILLFTRAEGQAFHVPGGDGGVITAAGFWTCVLIVWRIFDKEGTSRHDQIAYTSGIEWGIFVALGVAAVLTYAGSQIRLAHEPEPPLPGEERRPGDRRRRRGWLRKGAGETRRSATTRRAYPGPDMGAEDEWTQEFRARRTAPPDPSEAPTQRARAEAQPTPGDPSEAPTQRARAPRRSPHLATPRRRPPGACARAASPAPRTRPAPSRPAGPAPLTGERSRNSTSPSRRRPVWGARHRRSRRRTLALCRKPAPEDTPTPPPDPDQDQLTLRMDRPR